MPLKLDRIKDALDAREEFEKDKLWIIPRPADEDLKDLGAASIDLRLGRWFLRPKQTKQSLLEIKLKAVDSRESDFAERHFVRFGGRYILHPGAFALGATLEWIKIPQQCSASVVGKSSWGRRGLIIETAPTVHPGFSGCLTLEITNVGEVPIELKPGLRICQLILERAEGKSASISSFDLVRRPAFGSIVMDRIAKILSEQ